MKEEEEGLQEEEKEKKKMLHVSPLIEFKSSSVCYNIIVVH